MRVCEKIFPGLLEVISTLKCVPIYKLLWGTLLMLLSQRFEPSVMERSLTMKMTYWLLSYRATQDACLTTQHNLFFLFFLVVLSFMGFTMKVIFQERSVESLSLVRFKSCVCMVLGSGGSWIRWFAINLSHSMVLWRGRWRTTKMLSKKSEMRNLGKKVTSSRSSDKESWRKVQVCTSKIRLRGSRLEGEDRKWKPK